MDISVALVQSHLKLLSSGDDVLTKAVSTYWDKLKMPRRCWKSYVVRLDRSIPSPFCQKGSISTRCNFHFLNTNCISEDVSAINKRREGAKCSTDSQKQKLMITVLENIKYQSVGGANTYGMEYLPLSKFVE